MLRVVRLPKANLCSDKSVMRAAPSTQLRGFALNQRHVENIALPKVKVGSETGAPQNSLNLEKKQSSIFTKQGGFLVQRARSFDVEDTSDDIETQKSFNLWSKEPFVIFLYERINNEFDLQDETDDLEMLKLFVMWYSEQTNFLDYDQGRFE